MTHIEIAQKAAEIIRDIKGLDFKFWNYYENKDGSVGFDMHYPSGYRSSWSWPVAWFNPEFTSRAIKKGENEFDKIKDPDTKIIAKMVAFLWTVRKF